MKVRVNARRWDEPIVMSASEVVVRPHPDRPGHVLLTTPEGGMGCFELGAEFGETIEIIGDHEAEASRDTGRGS